MKIAYVEAYNEHFIEEYIHTVIVILQAVLIIREFEICSFISKILIQIFSNKTVKNGTRNKFLVNS